MKFKELLANANGNFNQKVESKWSTFTFTSSGTDDSGLPAGNYVIWVAQVDLTTNSGNQRKAGDWSAVLAK